MKKIFQPAIFLMNQLNFPKKFMALGGIFLIAVIEVTSALSVNLNATIAKAQRELDGLIIIAPLSSTMQLTQQHRGLTSGALGGNKSMRDTQALTKQKIVALLDSIDKQLPVALSKQDDWTAIKSAWIDIQTNSPHWALDESLLAHTKLIAQLQAFKTALSDHYGLSSVSSIDVHYLLETTVVGFPEPLELLGQMRGLGTGILAQKKLSENQSLRMRALIVRLNSSLQSLTVNLDKTSLYNPQIKASLQNASVAINLSSQQMIALIESDILSKRFDTTSDQFYTEMTVVIDGGYGQLHQALLPTAITLINQRIDQAEHAKMTKISIAILLLLLAFYLFIGIYYSTVDTVRSLVSSAKKIAGGDLSEHIALETHDELNLIGNSFNEMVVGLNGLMVSHMEDEVRLRAILDGALDASVQMDAQGNIKGWSPQAENIFGWSAEQVLGRPLHDFIIPMRYREAHTKGLKRFLASGEGPVLRSRIEIEALHRLGHEFFIELAISPVKTAGEIEFNAFIRDITERKKSENELRIAAIAFEALDGMLITDVNLTILKVNRAFTQVTGYSAEEAIGKNPSMLKSGRHDALFYKTMWAELNQSKFWSGEVWNRRKSGEIYPELLRMTAVMDKQDQVTNYVAAFTDISDSKKAEEMINTLAFYDPLTRLPNRRLMMERLDQMLHASLKNGQYGAILSVDLDNFKLLNDTKGHNIGDLMLIEVTNRLRGCTHTDDTVSRIGGDEFVVLLNKLSTDNLHAAAQVESVAERIRVTLNSPFNLHDHEYHSSCSIGICLFHDIDLSVDELFKHADSAMHQAKQSGRNAIRFFDSATQKALESRVLYESWLRKAIPDQLLLVYQPQVNDTGRIISAEALIRWAHPENGLISPAMFIPLAEETDLILPIGDWVMETACKQLKAWNADPALQYLQLAVNVSAKQFKQQEFVAKVLNILDQTGANPAKLKLELTESLLVDDVDTIIAKMKELKAIGVSFSLDDFGTGFSSLSYLKRLPLHQLKIDQSFVRNLLKDANDKAIVQTVIALGQAMGLSVIAEGVETTEQRDYLYTHGCHYYQGYLFGKPLAIESFERLFHSQPVS